MSDYIKREDALNGCKQWLESNEQDEQDTMWNHGIEACLNEIKHHVPSVDVVEVRHGRWIECVSLMNKSICSNCRSYWIDTDSQYDFSYCPRCGARMDGKDQDDKEYEDSILAAQKGEE